MTQKGITTSEHGDILADTTVMDWLDVGGGTHFQVLRLCEQTGQWALYVHMAPGARFQAHRHEGTGQFFVTKVSLSTTPGVPNQALMVSNPFLAHMSTLIASKKPRCCL